MSPDRRRPHQIDRRPGNRRFGVYILCAWVHQAGCWIEEAAGRQATSHVVALESEGHDLLTIHLRRVRDRGSLAVVIVPLPFDRHRWAPPPPGRRPWAA